MKMYEDNPLFADVRLWLEAQEFVLVSEKVAHVSGGNAFFTRADVRFLYTCFFTLAARKVMHRMRRR